MRTYAKVYVSIWAGDFRALSIGAQGLYFRLMTDPKLSMCGVVDWRPNRLMQSFAGMTRAAFNALAAELEDAHYIVVDADTEEALIRSFVRHDGVLKSPNLTKAMASDWLSVTSQKLKNAVVLEVRRTLAEEPKSKGSDSVPDWFEVGSESVPPLEPGNPSDSVPDQFPDPLTSNQQITTSIRALREAPTTPTPRKRPSTALPSDWRPSDANLRYADANGIDWEHELDQFTSHHQARDSRFVDWHAAFRTWLGNSAKWAKPTTDRRPSDDSWDHLKRDPDEVE